MSDQKKPKRRDFLFTASYTIGAVGIGAAVWPLIDQMNPDSSVKALASTEVDISTVEPGKSITVLWRGKPVFIKRRTQEEIAEAKAVKLDELKLSRLEIYNSLRNKGIGVNVHYIPVHLQPFYRNLGFNEGDFPNSENYYDGAITIPMFSKLKKKEIKYVIQALKESVY